MTGDLSAPDVLAGFGLGLAAGLLVPVLSRAWSQRMLPATGGRSGRYSLIAIGLLATLSAAYMVGDRREPVAADPAASGPVPVGATMAGDAAGGAGAGSTAGSMEDALAELSTRLATQGGTDADWELLAQSYDFLGRPSEAAGARQHEVSSERNLEDAVAASARMLGMGSSRMAVAPVAAQGATEALLAKAEEHRRKREFKLACDVFAAVAERGGMTADAWADYADAQAGVTGSLSGEPAVAIAAALAADPTHPKALWLKASLAHEERRFGDALSTWKQLLAVVTPGSSDARIVTANIAEATRLASN